jgi:16S rRNA (cytidine1402-2'-O)-methyltransferase
MVIVVGPPGDTERSVADVDALLGELLATMSVRAATDEAVSLTGLPRRELYRRALALRSADDGEG